MRVVVTRPEHEARQWVGRLRARGIDALALPLIGIGPAPDAGALQAAWSRLGEFSAVMFVSANAVRGFFGARPAGCAFVPRAWAPGPGTRDALLEAQVPARRIDVPADDAPQFDSEALWRQVEGQVGRGQRYLIVRGGSGGGEGRGRDWLAGRLAAAGAQAETVVAYVRSAPAWGEDQRTQAREAAVGATWLFSSSEAIANLSALLPAQGFDGARAVATHPRIAQAARDAGFRHVRECRPDYASVVAALESAA